MEIESHLPNWNGDNWISVAARHHLNGNDVLNSYELFQLKILSEGAEFPIAHSVEQAYKTVSELTDDFYYRTALLRMFTVFYYGTDTIKSGPYGIELDVDITEFDSQEKYDQLCKDLQRLEDEELPGLKLNNGQSSFLWMGHDQNHPKVLNFSRQSETGEDYLFVINRSAEYIPEYRLGVKSEGYYNEVLNSDSSFYGGFNNGNGGGVSSAPIPKGFYQQSIGTVLPPYSAIIFQKVT